MSMCTTCVVVVCAVFFFFQAEDGIRDLVRSRGLGDVYKRQVYDYSHIGHAKTYVSFDVVVRYLRFLGYDVLYVQLSLIHI